MWIWERGRVASFNIFQIKMLWQMYLINILIIFLTASVKGSSLDSKMKTSYACQGSKLNLSCPKGQFIKVMRANYGRFSVDICNEAGITDWSVSCMAPRSLRILQDRCNLKGNCQMMAESSHFGSDPCPNVPKYLEVYFGCFYETTTTTSTTPNPLPPWLTTKSPISFIFDLDLDHDFNIRVPVSVVTEKEENVTITPRDVINNNVTSSAFPETTVASSEVITVLDILSDNEQQTLSSTTLIPEPVIHSQSKIVKENKNRLLYNSENTIENNTEIRIFLSTLPPHETVSPSKSPHSERVSQLTMCPPRDIRALSWSWTRQGSHAVQACPLGTTGKAMWLCLPPGKNFRGVYTSNPHWDSLSPDLSNCQSVWMEKIIKELKNSKNNVNIASDLMQYISVNTLYGGDIKSAIDAITILAEKMQYQLRTIPTMEQREAMVMELVQSITKIASSLLSNHNIPAWQDLPSYQQKRYLSNFMGAMEKTGLLLPGAISSDQEVSISSDNLLLTARKISFKNIRNTMFPSIASLATPYWKDYSDSIDVSALVLMENMNVDGSEVVFLSLRNIEQLLLMSESNQYPINKDATGNHGVEQQVINSQVIHLSLGNSNEKVVVKEPLVMVFQHKTLGNVTNPKCVMWESNGWSSSHCDLVTTNKTHTVCECSRVGTFALLEQVREEDSVTKMAYLVLVIVSISVSVIIIISIILLFHYCHRIKVQSSIKSGIKNTDLLCFRKKERCWSLNDTPASMNETLCRGGQHDEHMETLDIVRNSDFMVLSRAALQAHETGERNIQTGSIPGPQVHHSSLQNNRVLGTLPEDSSTLPFNDFGRCKFQQPIEVVTQPQSGNHIYMEVDPLYYTTGYTGGDVNCDKGMVSSSSSQTSSGYSTAPSEHLYPSQSYYETTPSEDYGVSDNKQYQCQGMPVHQSFVFPSHGVGQHFATKERMMSVYSISQNTNIPMQQSSEEGKQFGANQFPTNHSLICKQLGGAERI